MQEDREDSGEWESVCKGTLIGSRDSWYRKEKRRSPGQRLLSLSGASAEKIPIDPCVGEFYHPHFINQGFFYVQ